MSGSGRFTGSGLNFFEGTFNPGNSPALVVLQGDIGFGANNTLTIELAGLAAGTEYDQIHVGQQAALGGKLQINLLDGFLPMVGDVFTFLIAGGGIVGDFSSVVLTEIAGLAFQLSRDANSVSLLVALLRYPYRRVSGYWERPWSLA